jgi:Carboxypeptidase regulatory-like domain
MKVVDSISNGSHGDYPHMAAATSRQMTLRCGFLAAAMACVLGLAVTRCAGQELPATYPVRGVVQNSITHQPIARALVADDASGGSVLTDAEGRFELDLPEGEVAITVRRPGYRQRMESRHAVKVGADIAALSFYLTPVASIAGHVTLSGGDEPGGLSFFIYRKRDVEGHLRWMQEGMATTDSGGDIRFRELDAPASYVLCSDPSSNDTRAVTYGYPSICFPGGADFASASTAPLTLSPGQQAEVEIALTRQRFYRVSITTSNLHRGQGASIEIHNQGGPQSASAMQRSMQPGDVEAELPNGSYYAEAHLWGRPSSYGRVDFKVSDGPITGLTLNPLPLQPLMVEVRKDFTASNSNGNEPHIGIVSGSMNVDNPGVNLSLIPADNLSGNPIGGNLHRPEGSTNSDLYEMDEITPGRYWVRADSYQAYVSSISSGDTDLAREPLTIGPGGSGAPIEITVRNDTGDIQGTVNSEANAGAATGADSGEVKLVFVYAIPQFAYTGRIAQMPTGPIGNFELPNLAPGTYSVIAFDRNIEINMDDADGLARISAQGQTVTVEAGGTAQVQVSQIHSGEESASQ